MQWWECAIRESRAGRQRPWLDSTRIVRKVLAYGMYIDVHDGVVCIRQVMVTQAIQNREGEIDRLQHNEAVRNGDDREERDAEG